MSFLIENSTSRALFFFFNDTATTEIYTLSLHDALPIYLANRGVKTANVPLVPNMPVPVQLEQLTTPLVRSEEHTSELQSHHDLVCRLLLEKKKSHHLL